MKKIIFILIILTLSINLHALTKNEKAFLEAAKNGDIQTIRYLINSEVDIDVQDQDGNTALMWASFNGHFDIVKLLVDNGAYIEIKNNSGITAIDHSKNSEILRLFIDIDPYYIHNNKTILIYQSILDNEENVKILLDKGIDVNYIGRYGTTALIEARSIEVVKILIDAGANINTQDDDGNTALIMAVWYNNPSIIKLLLQYGADTTMKNNNGQTALDIAKKYELYEIIGILEHYKK